MKLIAGLGNPGEKYERTRHNLGFMVIDRLLRKLTISQAGIWQESLKFNSQLAKVDDLLLVKPQTMMNASGLAVAKIADFYKIKSENIWVIHDDVDLPLGKMKIRLGGTAAGHRGVESLIKQLKTDRFVRFRLGIGHPYLAGRQAGRGADGLVEKYVLKEFDVNEKTEVKTMIKKAVKALVLTLESGLEKAMNQFNQ